MMVHAVVVLLCIAPSLLAMQYPNPYHILDVKRSDSTDAIRAAFKALAFKWHPDKNPAAKDTFARIRAAYDVLIDSGRRTYYDRYGRYPTSSNQREDRFQRQSAATGAAGHMYHRDPDRLSLSGLLTSETYPFIVEDNASRFGTIWLVKVYGAGCKQCVHIHTAWEETVKELQGVIPCGRINYDMSPELVRDLGIHKLPSIFAISPDPRKPSSWLRTNFVSEMKPSQARMRSFLESIPCRNSVVYLRNTEKLEEFISEDSLETKVVFMSANHYVIPVAFIAFMHQFKFPAGYRFAFMNSRASPMPKEFTEGASGQSDGFLLHPSTLPTTPAVVPELQDWYQLLCLDPPALFERIIASTRPPFPELTYSTYYETCFETAVTCAIILADTPKLAYAFAQGLKLSDLASPHLRIGHIRPQLQPKFSKFIGANSRIQANGFSICAVRASSQQFACFPGKSMTDGAAVHSWLDDISKHRAPMSSAMPLGGLPFLSRDVHSPPKGRRSGMVGDTVQQIMTYTLYSILLAAAVLILFIVPSLS